MPAAAVAAAAAATQHPAASPAEHSLPAPADGGQPTASNSRARQGRTGIMTCVRALLQSVSSPQYVAVHSATCVLLLGLLGVGGRWVCLTPPSTRPCRPPPSCMACPMNTTREWQGGLGRGLGQRGGVAGRRTEPPSKTHFQLRRVAPG
jgi:hypothetical protein